eukprot:1278832-Rhodomonas_salina.1
MPRPGTRDHHGDTASAGHHGCICPMELWCGSRMTSAVLLAPDQSAASFSDGVTTEIHIEQSTFFPSDVENVANAVALNVFSG